MNVTYNAHRSYVPKPVLVIKKLLLLGYIGVQHTFKNRLGLIMMQGNTEK